MAAASGIVPSQTLLDVWSNALKAESRTRAIKIVIDQESLTSSDQIDQAGSIEDDFKELSSLVNAESPSFLLYRLETPTSWLFISYVPDSSPVRSKMLYASSRQSLLRALGDARFSTSIFASTPDELTFKAYQDHLIARASSAPLTAREREMADLKAAEAKEVREGASNLDMANQPRSMLDLSGSTSGTEGVGSTKGGSGWSDGAMDLIRDFAAGEKEVIELQIDEEKIMASSPQPTTLSLPKDSPSFTFYKHPVGTVFIYSCPSSSPIKSRMIYASSFHSVRNKATELGVDVTKRLETSSPEEITDSYLASEFASSISDTTASASGSSAPSPAVDKPAFARPARPGRKR